MSVRILFFACKVRFIVTHFVLGSPHYITASRCKFCVYAYSPYFAGRVAPGIWLLVDLKMLNIASGEFSRYVCGQHHCVL